MKHETKIVAAIGFAIGFTLLMLVAKQRGGEPAIPLSFTEREDGSKAREIKLMRPMSVNLVRFDGGFGLLCAKDETCNAQAVRFYGEGGFCVHAEPTGPAQENPSSLLPTTWRPAKWVIDPECDDKIIDMESILMLMVQLPKEAVPVWELNADSYPEHIE